MKPYFSTILDNFRQKTTKESPINDPLDLLEGATM